MLRIHFGEAENVEYGPSWFKYNYKPEWFKDPFVQEMVKAVDDSTYIDGLVIDSPVLGPIPPERLSGGVKTLIMIYEKPELVFDATSCGQNCAKWLLEIGKKKDVTVNLEYMMMFDEYAPFEIFVTNEGHVLNNAEDLFLTAAKYI
ncbi:MAG: DUF4869 domain-containing protein [Lachnospiraceae bacterium]|nr:DUF4869 domain-containing protein [Lachnospiraceae bacterium]